MLKRKRESEEETKNQETTAKFIVDCIYGHNIKQPVALSPCIIPIWLFKMITNLSCRTIREYISRDTLFHLVLRAENKDREEDVLERMKNLEDLSHDTLSLCILRFIQSDLDNKYQYYKVTKVELNNIIFDALCNSIVPGRVILNTETKDGLLQLLKSYKEYKFRDVTIGWPLSFIKPGTADVEFVQKLLNYYDYSGTHRNNNECIRDYLSLVIPEQERLLQIPFGDVGVSDSSSDSNSYYDIVHPCMKCAHQLLESKHHSHLFFSAWHEYDELSISTMLFNNNSNLEKFLVKRPDDDTSLAECQDLFIKNLSNTKFLERVHDCYSDKNYIQKSQKREEQNIRSFELLFNGPLLQLNHCARVLYDPAIFYKASKKQVYYGPALNKFYVTYNFIKKIRHYLLNRCSKREVMQLLEYAPVKIRPEIINVMLPMIIETSGSLILDTIREYLIPKKCINKYICT